MSVKLVKLRSGESLLADFTEVGTNVVLKKPVLMELSMDGRIMMLPWPIGSDDKELTFSKDHVVVVVNAVDDIRNAYSSKFGSGLVIGSQVKLAGDLSVN
jgi:hypothetical protein